MSSPLKKGKASCEEENNYKSDCTDYYCINLQHNNAVHIVGCIAYYCE